MKQLNDFFKIPSYLRDLTLEIHSKNLLPLLNENPIEYMRHLYSTDSKQFYNVRDELVLRGIGLQSEYQSNYLLDKMFETHHIIYKENNTNAFEKIDFELLGANNFIERFDVRSDLFFKNVPLEGVLYFTEGVTSFLLQEFFNKAGFLVIPVSEYISATISMNEVTHEVREPVSGKVEYFDEEKSLKIVPTNNISMLDESVEYFYEGTIYLTFLNYCHINSIRKFSEITVDFIEKYRYQKHVRQKTVLKVMNLYHKIHREYNALQLDVSTAITLLQENSFKSFMEYINHDYLTFINDFYSTNEIGMIQVDFDFEKIQRVIESSDEIIAKNKLQKINQLIQEIENHPKYKYILNCTLAEIQAMFEIHWDTQLNLELYLFNILEDLDYKELFNDILVELNNINDIQDSLQKAANALKPRELEVLQLRQTKTLQEVGNIIGLTRERVRQIEVKSLDRLASYKKRLNLMMYFQYCTEHSKLVGLDEFMQIFEIDGNSNKMLLDIFFDMYDPITYLAEVDCFILTKDYEELRECIEKIDYTQPIIKIEELNLLFNEDIIKTARKLVDLLIRARNYKRIDNIYVKEKVSIIARINYLFEHVIKEPLEMDNTGYKLFKHYMEDIFKIPFDSNKRSTIARIAASENVILIDSNTFAPHNNKAITDEFLIKIGKVIDERLTILNYVDPRWMFKEYASLMYQNGVYSPVHLYSIIQLYLDDQYETGHGSSLYIFKKNTDILNGETILLNYLYEHEQEAKRTLILEDLKWKGFKLDQLLSSSKTILMMSNNIIKTIESFKFKDEELSEMRRVIESELEKGYVFTYDLQFELAFNKKLEPLIERCKLTNDITLAAVVKWLYPNINGHSKLLYWSDSSITKIEQAISAEFPIFLARNELIGFVEGKGYSEQTIYRLPTDILKEGLFYNYTSTKYINAKVLSFTDEVKQALASYLRQQFGSKAYCSIFSFTGYSKILMPISLYEWTEYLIGQFAEYIGYRKIQTHHDYRYDKTVLVKNDMPIENYEQLVLHILKTEYTGRYHEEDLAKYLVSIKVAYNPRRLTNEIYNSPLFKFDSFGFFEIRGEKDGTN